MNPEARRALRSVVQAIVTLALLALAWRLTDMLRNDLEALREIARGALIIIGLGTVFYGLENTTRAFKLGVGADGLTVSSDGDKGDGEGNG